MRIAFVADTLNGWVGGGVISGRHFVERLRRDHRVVVVGADVSELDGVTLPGFRLPLRSMRSMHFTMARPDRALLRDVFAGVDLVHLQFPFWLSYVALDEARRAGRAVVASFHVQPENVFRNLGIRSQALSRATYRFWVDRLYNRADAVVCPSRFAEEKLREHGLLAPAYVVSNGVPPDLPPPSRARRPAFEHGMVLSAGRLSAEKRPDLLLEAVALSRHRHALKVVLAGAGPLEARLRGLAARLHEDVEIGFVERPRLRELFGAADLFVHSSEVELEGIAVLEAMAMGLPVLVADSPESAASGLALDERFRFPSGDPAALAERIDALLDHPDVAEEARAKYAAAAARHDFGRSVERLTGIYEALLKRGG